MYQLSVLWQSIGVKFFMANLWQPLRCFFFFFFLSVCLRIFLIHFMHILLKSGNNCSIHLPCSLPSQIPQDSARPYSSGYQTSHVIIYIERSVHTYYQFVGCFSPRSELCTVKRLLETTTEQCLQTQLDVSALGDLFKHMLPVLRTSLLIQGHNYVNVIVFVYVVGLWVFFFCLLMVCLFVFSPEHLKQGISFVQKKCLISNTLGYNSRLQMQSGANYCKKKQ